MKCLISDIIAEMSNYNQAHPKIQSIKLKELSFIRDAIPSEIISKDSLTNPNIFYIGNLNLLQNRENISAVVGSRDPLTESIELTRGLVKYLVTKENKSIISGFAKGVDSIAFETALEFGGNRIGVLAISIDQFLQQNRDLFFDESLLLISLVDGKTKQESFDYKANPLKRNKYIYSLAKESFVIECSQIGKGGTWGGSTEYLRKIYPKVEEKSVVYVSKNEKFPAHFELEKRGAKYFELIEGTLNRYQSFKLF